MNEHRKAPIACNIKTKRMSRKSRASKKWRFLSFLMRRVEMINMRSRAINTKMLRAYKEWAGPTIIM